MSTNSDGQGQLFVIAYYWVLNAIKSWISHLNSVWPLMWLTELVSKCVLGYSSTILNWRFVLLFYVSSRLLRNVKLVYNYHWKYNFYLFHKVVKKDFVIRVDIDTNFISVWPSTNPLKFVLICHFEIVRFIITKSLMHNFSF